MTCDEYLDLSGDDLDGDLDNSVDGTLSAAQQAEVQDHLRGCSACRTLRDDLVGIRTTAAALGAIEPPARVWAGISAAVAAADEAQHTGTEGRDTDWRQWLAAAASLVLVSGGLWWLAAHLPQASVGQQARVELAPSEFDLTQAAYQSAIEELELVGTEDANAPAITAPALAALRESLADLDDVIVETRDDLAREPDDTLSQEHLLAALDNKVLLLQDTLALLDQTDQGAMP